MGFDSLAVTVAKGDERFHTLTVDDCYSSTQFTDVIDRLILAGYEIVSAVVTYDSYWKEEVVNGSVAFSDIESLYDTLAENVSEAGAIVAYVQEFGTESIDEYSNAIKFTGDSKSEIAQEWFDIYEMQNLFTATSGRFGEVKYQSLESLPSVLSIDWDDTLDNILKNEGNALVYLNGTWYMFG